MRRRRALLDVEEVAGGARFVGLLPSFLRSPINPEQARAIVRQRLEQRDADFLALIARSIYANPDSPYRPLLHLADCQYGDVVQLVRSDGVEGALRALYRHGVYFTVEEFKGRRPVARGSSVFTIDPMRLRQPGSAFHVLTQSSGSRGARTSVPIDLANIRDRAVNAGLHFEARGGSAWLYALWGFPGGWPINRLLQYAKHSYRHNPPVRWFSPADLASPGVPVRNRWSAHLLRWSSILAGVPLPAAQHVPLDQPLAIARWMADVLRVGRIPHLHCFASWAVRLCQAAGEAGIDLRGAQFMCGGEPLTAARLSVIRGVGAQAVPLYGIDEAGGIISHGCLAPEAPDEGHLYHDLHALVQVEPGDEHTDLPRGALLLTSLRRTAPLVLLNVSTGDRATVAQRPCGCPLQKLGWSTHLHTIRSFEKLTVGGLTVLDSDVIRVLDDVLPDRFGGGPTDYQLIDDGIADGRARLRLLVHPAVGPINEAALVEAFLTSMSGLDGGRMTPFLWREPGLLRVERRPPERTAAGKIHHVHLGGKGGGVDAATAGRQPR